MSYHGLTLPAALWTLLCLTVGWTLYAFLPRPLSYGPPLYAILFAIHAAFQEVVRDWVFIGCFIYLVGVLLIAADADADADSVADDTATETADDSDAEPPSDFDDWLKTND